MKLQIIFFILCLILILSCNSEYHENRERMIPIAYSTSFKSPFFNDKYTSISLDSIGNTLYVSLNISASKNIPYPVNSEFKDTLTRTAFNFEFYSDGQLIRSDYKGINNTLHWKKDTTISKNDLIVTTDTIDLEEGSLISFKLPLFAFHSLKNGKHLIKMKVYQDLFTDETYFKTDSSSGYKHLYAAKKLFESEITFEVNVPKIYKSKLYGFGLELRNDSTFSPVGMDNTIWNSSYPDIYWTIFYPQNELYAQTPYQKSTDRYTGLDTFTLYHYTTKDSIGIGVYDHDNLSRDDGLGYKVVDIQSLIRKYPKRISFDAIKWMDLKLKQEGIVN